jgi:hypothetical protein
MEIYKVMQAKDKLNIQNSECIVWIAPLCSSKNPTVMKKRKSHGIPYIILKSQTLPSIVIYPRSKRYYGHTGKGKAKRK